MSDNKKSDNRKRILGKRTLAVLLLVLVLIASIDFMNRFLCIPMTSNQTTVINMHHEPADSIDVLLLGSSATYSGFASAYAYELYGFTSYPYALAGGTCTMWKPALQDALRTQDPELVVVDAFTGGYDPEEIKRLMADLDSEGRYEVGEKIKEGLKCFYGGFADVEATNATIGEMYKDNRYLLDTHTAVAYKVYENYREETGEYTPTVIVSTASPYKFAKSVADSIGLDEQPDGFAYIREIAEKTGVMVPEGLRDLDKKEIRHRGVINTDEIEKTVLSLFE